MRLFRRRERPGQVRRADSADVTHLTTFAREWTRRRVADARAAHELANRLGIPSYDAAVVGYPQRMRDWNARKNARPEA